MRRIIGLFFLVLFLVQWGCAGQHKDIISRIEGNQPIEEVTPRPTEAPAVKVVEAPAVEHYTVKKRDSLWRIAGKVYKDCFEWPTIFKANRDQIQDPDLIYPKQVFVIDRKGDIAAARALAFKTPKYRPHTHPRKTLPLEYF